MNTSTLVMFLFILASILLGGHFFIYISLVKFLAITNIVVKMWLGGVLLFLGVSFIGASFLAHYNEGILARLIYSIFSFWLGIGWNLTMAFVVAWIIVGITKIAGLNFDYRYLVFLAVIFAISYSVWGAWNAYNPKIKNVTVQIKNLPEAWKNKKAVQLSDVHLGHIYGKKFLKKIIRKVNAQNPDLIFITGDLFDGMDGELNNLVKPLGEIKAKDGIYFITGNHETYLGVERSVEALGGTPIIFLDNKVIDVNGVQIVGISYPKRGEKESFSKKVKSLKDFNAKNPNILLYHNPNVAKEAKDLGINLQLAGHSHRGQIFPFQFITRYIYGKYHNGLTNDGDFNIYTSSGTGTWGPMMRTSGRSEIVVFNFK
jgi:uncharacterized protein